jgi:hypothetical protein
VAPQNVLAGNELGVLLAQHGHLDEAESLFKQCVATDASPEAWQNLAVVYARKGNSVASQTAMTESSKLAASQRAVQLAAEYSGTDVAAPADPTNVLAKSEAQREINAASSTNQGDKPRGGFWKKLDLSQKLPSIFRR